MLNKSAELKAERGYTDKKSFVRLDGSEVLFRQDWLERKVELFLRANGKCEWVVDAGMRDAVIMVYACGKEAADAHHIIPRSKGRDDQSGHRLGPHSDSLAG